MSKTRIHVLTVKNSFFFLAGAEFLSVDHVSDRVPFFVKQTLTYLPVADQTFVFCLFFSDILSSAMVDVMLHITLLFIYV